MSLLTFEQFIYESIETQIYEIVEDAFTSVCDDYSLNFDVSYGYFINSIHSNETTNWITGNMLKDVKALFDQNNYKLISKKGVQICFINNEPFTIHREYEITKEKDITKLKRDFEESLERFKKLNQTNFVVYDVTNITKESWQIVIYLIEK